jgi:putative transposase
MKRSRFTEEQIIAILKESTSGVGHGDLCRKHGISDQTLYNWKTKYAGLTVSDLRRLKALEEENRKLKTIVAEQVLDIQCLKAVVAKNF